MSYITINNYIYKKKALYEGVYSVIYKGTSVHNDKPLVIKKIKKILIKNIFKMN